METDLASQQPRRGHLRSLRPRERALVSLEGFISICGLAGGLYMMNKPMTVMDLQHLDGTWFHTWRWLGLLLFLFVGVGPLMVVIATLVRLPVAGLGHLCVGAGLVTWILVQAMWIVIAPPLQVTVALIGLTILFLGIRDKRDRGRAVGA